MAKALPIWKPTVAEVEQIIDELRPLIRGFAHRDEQALVAAARPTTGLGWEARLESADCG